MDLHLAPIEPEPKDSAARNAWNEAHDRLRQFLDTFALGDHVHVSRLALLLLEQAKELHRQDPSRHPTKITMDHAQKTLVAWLAQNLDEQGQLTSRILASGYIALLLSHISRSAPAAFLASPLPVGLKDSLRQTLIVTGPDLNISSMTPRRFDYGPMLDLARQTWHRWDARTLLYAMIFWGAVYTILYFWLSEYL
jgi:hypothetical protein